MSKLSKGHEIVKNCQNCQHFGQVMFPHYSDKMSQRSTGSLCVCQLTHSLSDKVTYRGVVDSYIDQKNVKVVFMKTPTRGVNTNTMQYRCNTIQCNAISIQCIAIQFNLMQCNSMQYQYNSMYRNTILCDTIQCNTNAIQFNDVMKCHANQCIVLHCIA